MSDEQLFELTLEQVEDYEFRVRFDGTPIPDLITDETSPLGEDKGPNPSRLLAAGVANCPYHPWPQRARPVAYHAYRGRSAIG
jgi:hypothetical protein